MWKKGNALTNSVLSITTKTGMPVKWSLSSLAKIPEIAYWQTVAAALSVVVVMGGSEVAWRWLDFVCERESGRRPLLNNIL